MWSVIDLFPVHCVRAPDIKLACPFVLSRDDPQQLDHASLKQNEDVLVHENESFMWTPDRPLIKKHLHTQKAHKEHTDGEVKVRPPPTRTCQEPS